MSMNYNLWQMKKKFNKGVKRLITHLFYEYDFYNYDYANASWEDRMDLKLPRIRKDWYYNAYVNKDNFFFPYGVPKNTLPEGFRERMNSYNFVEIYEDSPKHIENMPYQPHIYADSIYHPNSMFISEVDGRISESIFGCKLVDSPRMFFDGCYHPNSVFIFKSDVERTSRNMSELRFVDDWERQRWIGHELGIIDYSYYKVSPNSREIVVEITLNAPKKKMDSLEKTIHSVIYS